jgi:hypothetical protein
MNTHETTKGLTLAAYFSLACALAFLPILLWKLDLPFISSTSGSEYRVFEIFAACVTLSAVLIAAARLRSLKGRPAQELIPVILFTLLACYFVAQVTEFRPQSSDWKSYEHAARAILEGKNPYQDTGYLYPPLTALALTSVYQVVTWGSGLVGVQAISDFVWQGVFYLYQCSQFFLVMSAIALCYRLARMLGTSATKSAILVSLLFVFNTPLLRTLYFHQVNLWVLDLILIAVLSSSSMISGLALSIATHVKLYGGILFLPFLLMKRLSTAIWMIAGIAVIFLIQTRGGTDLSLWQQYIQSGNDFPVGTMFRDNSLHSIVDNTISFVAIALPIEPDAAEIAVRTSVLLLTVIVVIYFGKRWHIRERAFRNALRDVTADRDLWSADRLYGIVFDAIAMALIISPLVWEHHYVLALPFVVWIAVTEGEEHPWRIGAGTFLMFAVPVFDIYPISYHRIVGLMLLLSASYPKSTVKQTSEFWKR